MAEGGVRETNPFLLGDTQEQQLMVIAIRFGAYTDRVRKAIEDWDELGCPEYFPGMGVTKLEHLSERLYQMVHALEEARMVTVNEREKARENARKWVCGICTLHNNITDNKCDACNTPNPANTDQLCTPVRDLVECDDVQKKKLTDPRTWRKVTHRETSDNI